MRRILLFSPLRTIRRPPHLGHRPLRMSSATSFEVRLAYSVCCLRSVESVTLAALSFSASSCIVSRLRIRGRRVISSTMPSMLITILCLSSTTGRRHGLHQRLFTSSFGIRVRLICLSGRSERWIMMSSAFMSRRHASVKTTIVENRAASSFGRCRRIARRWLRFCRMGL